MYGYPGALGQFGSKPAKKRGRLSALAKYLEQQRDLFPVDLYTATLPALSQAVRQSGGKRVAAQGAAGARAAARSAAFPPATKRGGKVNAETVGEYGKPLNLKEKGLS